jgi:hypothetical protein
MLDTSPPLLTRTNLLSTRTAVFSPCLTYRYHLQETWGPGPTQTWLMLNPSTADEMRNDPTVARCQKRAERGGFGSFGVLNLFALRSTDPKGLYCIPDPIGPHNTSTILQVAQATHTGGGQLVCAWGNHGAWQARADEILTILRTHAIPLFTLGTNANGSPKHPLYVPDKTPLTPF